MVTVHEDVAPGRMAVEVTEEEYLARLLRLFHHQFRMIIDWIEFGAGAYPLSVQVLAHQRTPIIANDDAVGIQHRYDLEHEGVS